ncbi:MAG: TIGR02281 family clan AA aspartic protease [Methylotenera sp.]|nr:TIGR02281 family clan AA aspartic protease [Methylotenera sp.]
MVYTNFRQWMLIALSVFLSLLSATAFANTRVNIVGLYNNKAVVIINNGKPRTLSVGQTVDGVKLIAADSSSATLVIEGETKKLGMGQAASVADASTNSIPSVTLYANAQGHFVSECKINGATLKFLIDTGATTVALNSGDAKFAKIDYKKGEPVLVGTANGVVTAYKVTIANLKIGGITLHQVEGNVLEGGSPSIVLMGMSALSRMDIKQQSVAMTLTKKY